MVKKWAAEFTRGWGSIDDDPRSGSPKNATTDENVEIVHNLVMCDKRRDLRSVVSEVGIRFVAVQTILTDILSMPKVSARWVPRMLTEDQTRFRLDISRYLLSRYEDDPGDFIDRVVTQDETWVHHFEPESKMQSMELKHPGSPPPKKVRRVSSAGKVMASVFWDSQGVIMIDYLEQGRTINDAYYAAEQRSLRQEIARKRRGKLTRVVLLLQNAPAHTSQVAMTNATECGFEVLLHPHILLIWPLLTPVCSQIEIQPSWNTVWEQ